MNTCTNSASERDSRLTTSELRQYDELGYAVVNNLVSKSFLGALRDRICEYTHGERHRGAMVFQQEPAVAAGKLAVAHPGDAVRKIAGLVRHDDLFRQLACDSPIVEIISQILGPDIKLYRDAMFVKPPRVGSAKVPHQDSPYFPIEPTALCSCWFALDDATPDNGCMLVIPGAHRLGPLVHEGPGDEFAIAPGQCDFNQALAVPVSAGGGLFFHSLLPHATAPNRTEYWRRSIALTYMSARSRFTGEGVGPEHLQVRGRNFPGCVR